MTKKRTTFSDRLRKLARALDRAAQEVECCGGAELPDGELDRMTHLLITDSALRKLIKRGVDVSTLPTLMAALDAPERPEPCDNPQCVDCDKCRAFDAA